LAGGVVLLDQVTKQLAVAHLAGAEPVRLLGGAVYLVYTTNSGAAFGLGRSHTYLFAVIAFAVIGWIAWMARRLRSLPWAVALGLLTAGAAGNLLDRRWRGPGPFRGGVVDMLRVCAAGGGVFPAFNVADGPLPIGVVTALRLQLSGRHRDGAPRRSPPSADTL